MSHDNDYANYLTKQGLAEIKKMEKELGTTLVAFATPPVPAKLSKAQLARVKVLENKHCVRLVAYTKG